MSETFNRNLIPWKKCAIAGLGGILYAAGHPMKAFGDLSFFWSPLVGISLLLFSLNMERNQTKQKLTQNFLVLGSYSVSFCILGYYWIPYTLKEFGAIPFPLNYLLGIIFSFAIAPHLIAFVLLIWGFSKCSWWIDFQDSNHRLYWPVLALALTILELVIPQQFPGHVGHSWMSLAPNLGIAPYLGSPFYSFISFYFAINIFVFIKKRFFSIISILTFFIFLIGNYVIDLPDYSKEESIKTNIRLVQANVGNFMKIMSEKGTRGSISTVFNRYKNLSLKPTTRPLDLIVWPETAYPTVMSSEAMKTNPNSVPTLIRKVIKETQSELFIGGYDKSPNYGKGYFETEYNTGFHFGKYGLLKNRYHKMKLIPFGENLPFGPFNKFLSEVLTNVSFFAKGKDTSLFHLDNGAKFINAICYEVLFTGFIRNFLNSVGSHPHFMINLTNDSWYGDTSEPRQHLFLAKWRAIEFQLPIVRMTNTGISSIIYANGEESNKLNVGEQNTLDLILNSYERSPTLYQRVGWWPLFLITFLLMLCEWGVLRLTRKF